MKQMYRTAGGKMWFLSKQKNWTRVERGVFMVVSKDHQDNTKWTAGHRGDWQVSASGTYELDYICQPGTKVPVQYPTRDAAIDAMEEKFAGMMKPMAEGA
jgi:hypothetical protein